jgi:hypothetical protein
MGKFFNDFNFFWAKIESGDNFTFTRYADGEVMLMNGISVKEGTQAFNVDKWSAPSGITKVGKDLLETLNHTEKDYYYAISSKTDNIDDYLYLKNNIKQNDSNITFVNLWINANYQKSIEKYNSLNRDVTLICNHKAKKNNFPFNINKIIPFPDNCVEFWEISGDSFIEMLINEIGEKQNGLFFISCGPVSEIIIHKLYINNPNNSYIDVGSSIDEFVHGKKTRPYMDNNTIYSKMISNF